MNENPTTESVEIKNSTVIVKPDKIRWDRVILGGIVFIAGIGMFFFVQTRIIAPAILGFGIGFLGGALR